MTEKKKLIISISRRGIYKNTNTLHVHSFNIIEGNLRSHWPINSLGVDFFLIHEIFNQVYFFMLRFCFTNSKVVFGLIFNSNTGGVCLKTLEEYI